MEIAGAGRRACEPLERSSSESSRLTREQVVDRIITINRSATSEFLAAFADRELQRYLARISHTERGPTSRWVRPGDAAAITWDDAER